MREIVKSEINGKQITLFKSETISAPVVYVNMYGDETAEILSECEKQNAKPFHFAGISGLRWNEELSPWKHDSVISKDDNFTGEAEDHMRFIEEKIIPFVEETIAPDFRVIAGYSMGGLFALYSPYISEAFSGAVSASGSVWYPGFVSYVKEHNFRRTPNAVYLSVGDKESRSRNQYLSTVQSCTDELYSVYKSRSINTAFELNSGNHFKDAPYRTAKGIAWALSNC